MLRILDVGCNEFDRPGELYPDTERAVVRLDADPDVKPDIVHDIVNPLPDEMHGAFDVVICSHVLEHISWRAALVALNNICQALADDGKLWLIVPDIEWAAQMILRREMTVGVLATLYGGQNNEWDYHRSGWTESALRMAVDKVGLKVERVRRTGINITINGNHYVANQIVVEARR